MDCEIDKKEEEREPCESAINTYPNLPQKILKDGLPQRRIALVLRQDEMESLTSVPGQLECSNGRMNAKGTEDRGYTGAADHWKLRQARHDGAAENFEIIEEIER